jgi:ABC-2 type transport system ATP-binding protein
MENDIAIKVENVSKIFKLPLEKNNSIKGIIVNFYHRNKKYELQKALKDISFEVKKGEFFGVVGRNGSGKSTLLKLLAGIYAVDKGSLKVEGSLTPFIELGVGFNPELTGRENVFLNGALLGFNRKKMQTMYQDIVEFAELERFMDQKLKNYSSGMQVRLAFSIAIRAETDILLIDEVLAVGDALFQQKCYDYFDKIKSSNKTVVFISHDMGAIQSFCDRAMLINEGKFITEGTAVEVTQKYSELLADSAKSKLYESTTLQHVGAGGAEILKASLINSAGKAVDRIKEGESFSMRIYFKAEKQVVEPTLGIGIMGQQGQSILGPNTKESEFQTKAFPKRGFFEAKFNINPLSPGTYRVRAGIFNTANVVPYDFVEHLMTFTVIGKKRYGDIYIKPEWSVGEGQ